MSNETELTNIQGPELLAILSGTAAVGLYLRFFIKKNLKSSRLTPYKKEPAKPFSLEAWKVPLNTDKYSPKQIDPLALKHLRD